MSSGPRSPVADVLERIVAHRRRAVQQAKQNTPAAKLEERAAAAPPVRDFVAALGRKGLNVIAELKKASPSRGVLRADYNPAQLAPALEAVGACALSVLTEPEFFHGALEDLQVARAVTRVPALRKDFLFDPYQLYEARAAGADAFLLIAAILKTAELQRLITLGKQLGMAALVEAHTADELERALEAGADIIMLDNMSLEEMREAVGLIAGRALVEASGGVNLETIRGIAETGVDTGERLGRPDLERAAQANTRVPGHQLDRVVHVLRLEHEEPAQLLPRLGERAVRHQHLARLPPQRLRRARALQRLAPDEVAVLAQHVVVGEALLHQRVLLALRHRVPPALVHVSEAHELHDSLLVAPRRRERRPAGAGGHCRSRTPDGRSGEREIDSRPRGGPLPAGPHPPIPRRSAE